MWKSRFNIGHTEYLFMEQYMMAEKARFFGDKEIEEKIMNSYDPKEIKSFGRKVRGLMKKFGIKLNIQLS